MKICIKAAVCLAALSACAPPVVPPTDGNVLSYVQNIRVAQTCIDTNRTRYLPETVKFIDAHRRGLAGATTDQINGANRKLDQQYPGNRVDDKTCRTIEVESVRLAQQQSDQQRQEDIRRQEEAVADVVRAQNNASWASAQQNAFNSRPVTCTHYQWGNTTFCN